MEPLPPTSPHFLGLWVGLAGLALVAWVATRPWFRRRFGSRGRAGAVGAMVVLLAVAFFGNGVRGTAMRGLLTPLVVTELPMDADRVGAATEAAVDVALSDEFIRYHAALHGRDEPAFDGDYIRARLELERATYGQLESRGQTRITPPPPRGTLLHVYRYYDARPYFLHLLGVGTETPERASRYLERALNDIDGLVLLEAYRLARTDDERLAVLRMLLGTGVPYYAEWIARDLRALRAEGPSAPVAEAMDRVLAWTATYVEDPTLRALPADGAVEL